MRSHPSRPLRRIQILVALAVLLTPALLFAHALLVRSDPAKDAVLAAPPAEIRLWFSEQPDIHFSRITLQGAKGREVEIGALSTIPSNGLRVPIPSRLAPGPYLVYWRTAASDGHASNGRFRFTVAGDTTAAAPSVSKPETTQVQRKATSNAVITPAATVTASTPLRWAEFVALLTLIGVIIFRLAVLPAAKWPEELVTEANDRARRLAIALAILFLIATLTRALAQTQMLATVAPSRLAGMQTLVTTTRWGLAWALGAAGAIAALVALLIARASLASWIAAAVGIVLVTMSEGLTGHSGTSQHLSLAMAMDVAHQLGAGGWLGGLVCVVIAGLPSTRRLPDPDAALAGRRLVRSFHGSALECVALVVVSGVVASILRLGAVSDLWTTPYGSMLFRKLVFVSAVLGFGYFHWRRFVVPEWDSDARFRFARSAVFELVVGAVVVAFTALLVSTALPR